MVIKQFKIGEHNHIQSIKGVARSDMMNAIKSLIGSDSLQVDQNLLAAGIAVRANTPMGKHMIQVTPSGESMDILVWSNDN
jgi:hypothetical protein